MTERFPNNSRFGAKPAKEPDRPEPEKKGKVIEGTAMKRKKGLGEKFSETFVKGDIHDVGKHILNDILIPSAIETVGAMGHNLVDGMIYGDDAPSRSANKRRRNLERTSIDRGTGREERRRKAQSIHNKRSLIFDDIIVDSREEADLVLNELKDDIYDYKRATVSSLYRAVGWDNYIDYTTDDYGWYDLDGVRPIQVRVDNETKWTLNLPRAEYLD